MPVALSTGRKHSLSRFPSKSTFAAADFFVLALCQSSGWAAASSTSQGDVENPTREDIYDSTKTLVFHAAGTLYLDVSQSAPAIQLRRLRRIRLACPVQRNSSHPKRLGIRENPRHV